MGWNDQELDEGLFVYVLPIKYESCASPDVSLVSTAITSSFSWSPSARLSSDHLPILLPLLNLTPPPRTRRSYTNFRRADWPSFTKTLDALLPADLPTSASSGEKILRKAIQDASKKHIPAGYRRDFDPRLSRAASELQRQRDQL